MEKQIEKYLVTKVKKLGGVSYKFTSPGKRSVPDRIVLLPEGKILFIEVKSEGKKLTTLQKFEQDKLSDLGFKVLTVDSKVKIDQVFVDTLKI